MLRTTPIIHTVSEPVCIAPALRSSVALSVVSAGGSLSANAIARLAARSAVECGAIGVVSTCCCIGSGTVRYTRYHVRQSDTRDHAPSSPRAFCKLAGGGGKLLINTITCEYN
jgi:hypothetical protein